MSLETDPTELAALRARPRRGADERGDTVGDRAGEPPGLPDAGESSLALRQPSACWPATGRR